MTRYDHAAIEKKWQQQWAESGTYRTTEDASRPKAYVLDMFPYPSGEGLHVGHPKGYIATDVLSRMYRMRGHNVLHPMGWDAFGLPAENFAIKNKIHPRMAVEKNIARYKSQLSNIGLDYDWNREINTTDPEYYKWTQWIFLQLYKKGLAYESHEPIIWCPSCMTGLAHEDLEDGKCERCGSEVEKKPLRQWVLRITDYADRLLNDLDELPAWPEHIKEMQRNWIGRSEGAEIDFTLANGDEKIRVFTTRPDTLFGATYVVLAPEHPLVAELSRRAENVDEIAEYVEQASRRTEIERTAEGKEKTGVELRGIKAINPANGEEIPVWIADYVLAHYGTGAIMAVPAHDERDLAFAKSFNLPIKVVVKAKQDYGNVDQDKLKEFAKEIFAFAAQNDFALVLTGGAAESLVANGAFGIHSDIDVFVDRKGRELLERYLNEKGLQSADRNGHTEHHEWNNHKWFWGDGVWLDVFLLEQEDDVYFDTVGAKRHEWGDKAVLQSVDFEGVSITIPTSELREQIDFILSHAWNFCFTDPGILVHSDHFSGMDSELAKQKLTEAVGGQLKATYRLQDWVFSRQRYWGEPIPLIHCEKCGVVPVPEEDLPVKLPEVDHYEPTGTGESPLAAIEEWVHASCPQCGGTGKRETNTMPQWAGSCWYYLRFTDPQNDRAFADAENEKHWMPVDVYVGGAEHATRHLIYARFWHKVLFDLGYVSTNEPFMELHSVGLIMAEDGRKMSKRYGNVINPDEIVAEQGADTLRVYEMFMGPFDNAIAWNTRSLVGARRFLDRIWAFAEKVTNDPVEDLEPVLHQTIKKVTEDVPAFKFNTAISQLMICLNALETAAACGRQQWETFLKLLAPFAPHIAEELWHQLGSTDSIHLAPWPEHDESKLVADTVTIAVQVNGKTRTEVTVAADATEETIRMEAEAAAGKWITGEIKKAIYVSGRLINFVIS